MTRIAFIGGGNMATAIIAGMIASGTDQWDIIVSDPDANTRMRLGRDHGVRTTENAAGAANDAEVIVLAVKPQIIPAVAANITAKADLTGKLLLSIAAGTSVAALERLFGDMAIVRTMPNMPALVQQGATGVYLSARVTGDQKAAALALIASFGVCVEVPREDLLDAVTAVSGSGPAYVFLMIEAMIKAGMALGLSAEDASLLARQTAIGAAAVVDADPATPEELRRRVTSPNGTTHAAISRFESDGFSELVSRAMTACRDRSVELGK